MKKERVFFICSILAFAVLFLMILSSSKVHADLVNIDPTSGDADVLGINPETLPETPGEFKDQGTTWLKEQWAKLTWVESINDFFEENQIIFRILFNEKYDPSWFLILVLILWGFFWSFSYDFYRTVTNQYIGSFVGFLTAILLAQILVLRGISNFFLILIYKPEAWWAKLIIIFILLIVFILLKIFSKDIKLYVFQLKKKHRLWKIEREAQQAKKEAEKAREIAGQAKTSSKGIKESLSDALRG